MILMMMLLPFAWINPLKGCLGMNQAIFVISFEWEWKLLTKTEMKMWCTYTSVTAKYLPYLPWMAYQPTDYCDYDYFVSDSSHEYAKREGYAKVGF